ncbi:hypothetical protein QMN21_26740, partial [Serratia sp. Se-PFBMAAmG]|nr:hypothetical protein [Serratia sp. Se-PFBMAAmG]
MSLLKLHTVWRRPHEGAAVVYYCFEDLNTGKFCVQNADFFHSNVDALRARSDALAMELFMEESPLERCSWADSITAAIEQHDRKFENH